MSILDLFFPKRCVACKKAGEYICSDCFSLISYTIAPRCLICQKLSLGGLTHPVCTTKYSIDGCFSGVAYKGVVKKLLYTFKYKPYLSNLEGFLGTLLYESLIQNEAYIQILSVHDPIFIPIPLSPQKFRQRGYNQAKLLAKELAKQTSGEVIEVLQRTRTTKPQYGLSREEREKNIKGAFEFNAKGKMQKAKVRNIFLVDDVVTTGSTLVEAANVLKRNGVEKVWGITLAQD
jgi:ComF family protein